MHSAECSSKDQSFPLLMFKFLPQSCMCLAALKLLLQKQLVCFGGRAVPGEKKKETETFKPKLHGDYSCCSQPCEVMCIIVGFI